MKLFLIFLLLILHIIASNASNLDLQEHNDKETTDALSEDGQFSSVTVSKTFGGSSSRSSSGSSSRGYGSRSGSSRGYGGSSSRGYGGSRGSSRGYGGRSRGYGDGWPRGSTRGFVPLYAADSPHHHHHHRHGSACATAQPGFTLSAVLLGLVIYLIQF